MSRIFFILLIALLTLTLACGSPQLPAIPTPKPVITLAPTSAPTPAPTPTIDRMTEYSAQMVSLGLRLSEAAEHLKQRLIAPAYDNRYWVLEVRDLASHLAELYEEAVAITPPPSLEAAHDSFALGLKHYAAASSVLSDELASAERGDNITLLVTLSEVREQMALANANFTYAMQLLQGGGDFSALVIPTIRPRLPSSTTPPTPKPTLTRELEPVPTFPGKRIAVAESDSVLVYLGEQTSSAKSETTGPDGGKTRVASFVHLTIQNIGNSVVRIGEIWLTSDPDCHPVKGRSNSSLMLANIVGGSWLEVTAVPSGKLPGGFSQKTFFREEQDLWAKEHPDEFGYSFELFPERWISIFAHGAWSPERFGECVQIRFEVDGKRINIPLPRPE